MTDFTDLEGVRGGEWAGLWTALITRLTAVTSALEGLGATSTTSLSIGTGAKAFDLSPATTEFPEGTLVRARRASDATTFMVGPVTTTAAGSVTITVPTGATGGSGGPYTDWILTVDVSMSPARMTPRAVTASGTVTIADLGNIIYCTGTDALAFDPVATLAAGFWTVIVNISGVRTLDPDGAETIDGATTQVLVPGDAVIVAVVNGALRVVAAKGYGAPLRPHPTIQTGNFDAASGFLYQVNTAGGAITATLDAAPAQGAQVGFVDATGSFGTANLTLGRNGNTIDASAADFVCDVSRVGAVLHFNDTSNDWRLQ